MENCLFDFPTYSVNKKIRLIELFGGIGSQAMALRDIGADFEHYKLVEFDKYAVASYNAIHNTQHTTHDIRQIHAKDLEITDKDKYCYLMTYSFPCTDLSVAGKMKGMSKDDWQNGNSTRSGLLWEVERILKEMTKEELPDILLMENVPQVHAEKNSIDFENWLRFLRSKGYQNYWQDINAKDLGIPQNRERTFCISILSDEYVDFEFPEEIELEYVMRDFLEEEVAEKYIMRLQKAKDLIKKLEDVGIIKTQKIRTKRKDVIVIGEMDNSEDGSFDIVNRIYDKNGISPTINTCAGGNLQPKIIEETKCVGGLSEQKWGNSQYHQQHRVYKGDIALAQPAQLPKGSYNYLLNNGKEYNIRKLTPKECWRLMGYLDKDYDNAKKENSGTQLYKQAGNAIVKQVLMAIFSQLNIKGVKAWNDMTETEKRDIIKKTTMAGE
jgi:DNA (cytosine-5)-methyltransferase 1